MLAVRLGVIAALFSPVLVSAEVPTFADVSAKIFRPICLDCHGQPSPAADLDLGSYVSIMKQKVVVPSEPNKSLLFEKVSSGEMPQFGDSLTKEQLDLIHDWIAGGALDAPAAATPTLKSVTPSFGPIDGGTEVVLGGEMLKSAKVVRFGDLACIDLRVVSDRELRCRTPKQTALGAVSVTVTVTVQGETATHVLENGFDYRPALRGTYESLFANVLKPKCLRCHNTESPEHGLSVASYEEVMSHRRAVVPYDLKKSRIYKKTREGEMPRGGPRLPANEVAAIGAWIRAGAPEK